MSNLNHALGADCNDPDCEIHNIVVAAEELVIDETNLAYWFAGARFEAENPGMAGIEMAKALEAMRTTEARMDAEDEARDEAMSTEGKRRIKDLEDPEALNPGQGE